MEYEAWRLTGHTTTNQHNTHCFADRRGKLVDGLVGWSVETPLFAVSSEMVGSFDETSPQAI